MKAEEIVRKLTSFPNRACGGEYQDPVIEFLTSQFSKENVVLQTFKTPRNYLVTITWLISGIILGLFLSSLYPIFSFLLILFFGLSALRFFNWYSSPVSTLPPLVSSKNIIIKDNKNASKKVIMMAHWDTAPISILYSPALVGNFRSSLKMNLILIVFALVLGIINLFFSNSLIFWLTTALAVYFVLQMIVASIDFFRFGYSNGASDNATGVAAAIETAKNLWDLDLPNVEVELVITGAEEVGMIGAKAYYDSIKSSTTKETFLINFDTLGAGSLKVINETGSWSNIVYDNNLTQAAQKVITENPNLSHVKLGAWHTADFDSVWFHRGGIPSVTLAALDSNGRMPNIHRETDVINNVDFTPMHDAIILATELVKNL
jgi:Peptidase family M28